MLVPLLAATHEHLPDTHNALAERVAQVTRDSDQARHDGQHSRQRAAPIT
ncbi:hypothetical protein [Phytohabitans houttuyneae]|uniref:Uncharacterized protein n=2 Tax=Phytohabitans houttuyneae TaxID=1076126 RepID=A0A6V8KGS3_9ACTN|nr:hypothetical protein [Phytohabitans houttuyneae]GFJ81598.1 hypothetical protein Phou_057780 [Phytohabitans houttuyneae]